MDFNALIDVVLGLAFLYLLLALFVTIVNEWIAGILKLRARNLRRAIRKLLSERLTGTGSNERGPDVVKAFEQSPTYRSALAASGITAPSYLPAKRFALGLFEAVDAVKSKAGQQAAASDDEKSQIDGLIETLPKDSLVRAQLQSLYDRGATDLATFTEQVESWYDDTMERARGVFRRWMQALSFVIALILCAGLNVDTLHVAERLWTDEALRTALAAAAAERAEAGSPQAGDLSAEEVKADLEKFPIGWDRTTPYSFPETLLGWLLSAIAVSLGAPFWFGVLQRVASIRNSGNAQATPAQQQGGNAGA